MEKEWPNEKDLVAGGVIKEMERKICRLIVANMWLWVLFVSGFDSGTGAFRVSSTAAAAGAIPVH